MQRLNMNDGEPPEPSCRRKDFRNMIVMKPGSNLLAVFQPLPQWLDFLAMVGCHPVGGRWRAGLVCFVPQKTENANASIITVNSVQLNPTLAETGGLPPHARSRRTAAES